MDQAEVSVSVVSEYSMYGIKFTDNIQTTEYEEDMKISDDENEPDKHKLLDPYLKRLYLRTRSQEVGRVRYFTHQDRQDRDDEDSKEGK